MGTNDAGAGTVNDGTGASASADSGTASNGGEGGGPAPVPYERFRQVNDKLRQVSEERTALESRLAAREAELTSQVTRAQEDRHLARLGLLDDEGVDIARLLYGRVPEAERPKGGLVEWLQAQRSTGAIHKGLAAWMGSTTTQAPQGSAQPAAAQTATPAAAVQAGRPAPTDNGGVVQSSVASARPSDADIAAATKALQESPRDPARRATLEELITKRRKG